MNQKEKFCKQILENLFPGNKFIKIRHPHFKNPETGRSLELDLYCKELKLACEYNGPQHYKFMEFYHKIEDNFEKQKTRDLIKEGFCDIFEIELITVPNIQKYENIKEFITKTLDSRYIKYNYENMPKEEPSNSIKTCHRCGKNRKFSEFYRDKTKKDGYRACCKKCYSKQKDSTQNKEILKENDPYQLRLDELYREFLEFYNSAKKLEDMNEDSLEDFGSRCLNAYREIKYAPTNIFELCEFNIPGSDRYSKIVVIKSKLSLFLMQKKGIMNAEINVKAGHKNKINGELTIKIESSGAKLTHGEIEDFRDIVRGITKEIEISEILIKEEGVNIFQLTHSLVVIVIDFLRIDCGNTIKKSSLIISYGDGDDSMKIIWPKEYAISPSELEKLYEKITDFIVVSV
jgi:hypothetical protein